MEQTSKSNALGLLLAHAKEYHNKQFRFFEHGFISYILHDDPTEVTIVDIFVVDYKRRKGLAFEYANTFQDELSTLGVTRVYGMVQKDYKGKEASIAALEYWGMEVYTEDIETIYYTKEI